MNKDKLRERARKKLYWEWQQTGDFDIGIEATLAVLGEVIEIPEGWEEFHREMGGKAVEDQCSYMDIRLPHPQTGHMDVKMGFLPEFLSPKTKVGMILIRPLVDKERDRESWHKDLSIIACVEPLVLDAQLCLAAGTVYEDEGLFQEALEYYEKAEKGFIRARQRWNEVLDNWEWPPKSIDLKQLITTGYTDGT